MQFVDFYRMVHDQRQLQIELYGEDPCDWGDERKVQYIKDMILALSSEVHEMLQEVQWKPWSSRQGEISRDAFVSEAVDSLQFLLNLFAVVGAGADEIFDKLIKKHGINRQRIRDGYDNREKCAVCKRALDDATTRCTADRCADSLVGPAA